ncbi:kelch repeat and BTB domain-containing protein 13 [Solea senegalensis]|uniref:Kelch repeat and BTB domain-containing protein 13 n=1 Tax=Solea senegalensis TaxID=28829 RepID=A0AAV6Q519_SOLSE|nr:kelch repeat and BTB domain-containing protein 13 [Solea senegalensis]KAG7483239.1 kelch repeat and BTB domain-containing protein 13 [Solea senegalensis]
MKLCNKEVMESRDSKPRPPPPPPPPHRLRININGNSFFVDRGTLAENCEYFRALFQSGMIECRKEEIQLQCVGVLGFSVLLRVLDGERPTLNSDQIVEAIECTAFLQVSALTKHLINVINSENCLLMYHTAATYGVWELSHSSALFIRDMYADLREELHTLPNKLVDYIQSLLPSSYMAVCSHSPSTELLPDVQRTVWYLEEEPREWKVLTHLPASTSTTMAGVAVLQNRLYIIGGVHDVSKKVVETGFCYDPETNAWSTICGPQQLRYNLTLIGHEDCLYAVGGEYNKKAMSSVERYQVSDGSWSFVSALPVPAASVASAVAMNRMFICLWRGQGATDIFEYTSKPDQWLLVTTLVHQHSYGIYMVAHNDNLYVMRNGPCEDFLRCVIDCYSLTSGQWTAMSGQYGNSKGSLLTAVVRGDSVFTLSRQVTTEYTVDRYRWRPKREMQGFGRIGSMYTFLLRLPKASMLITDNSLDVTNDQNIKLLSECPILSPQCSSNL